VNGNSVEIGSLRNGYDHQMAREFLAEAKHPPPSVEEQRAWRLRWGPWLLSRSPGPIGPKLAWHRRLERVLDPL
jgi:hypothetical protein